MKILNKLLLAALLSISFSIPVFAQTLDDIPDGTFRFAVNADDQFWIENTRSELQPVAYTGVYADLTGQPPLAPVALSGSIADITDFHPAEVASTGAFCDLDSIPDPLGCDTLDHLVTTDNAATTLAGYVTSTSLTSTLSGYETTSALSSSLSGKEPSITAGTTSQYWRGDKTFQTLNKSAVGLSNVDNVADASKTFSASQITSGTKTNSFISDFATATRLDVQFYDGTTQKLGGFPVVKSATVASGVAVFNFTSDGTSTGTALWSTGPSMDSVQVNVNDATAAYQMGWAWSNSNKTLTVTTNKLSTANILTGILGQSAGNGAVVKAVVWGN